MLLYYYVKYLENYQQHYVLEHGQDGRYNEPKKFSSVDAAFYFLTTEGYDRAIILDHREQIIGFFNVPTKTKINAKHQYQYKKRQTELA